MSAYQPCAGCGAHVPSGEKLCMPCHLGEEMNLQGYPKPTWASRPPDGSGPGWEHVTYIQNAESEHHWLDRPQGWKSSPETRNT